MTCYICICAPFRLPLFTRCSRCSDTCTKRHCAPQTASMLTATPFEDAFLRPVLERRGATPHGPSALRTYPRGRDDGSRSAVNSTSATGRIPDCKIAMGRIEPRVQRLCSPPWTRGQVLRHIFCLHSSSRASISQLSGVYGHCYPTWYLTLLRRLPPDCALITLKYQHKPQPTS
ncbi:hypothetical protein VTG60DRAFT_2856 [Thermothelomyces hinnuleus]